MADAITPDAPAPGSAPVTTPAAAPADPSKTLLTAETPPVDPAKPDPAKAAEAPAEAAKPVIPEKYDFSALKLPEGITLSDNIVNAVSPIFKELGLSQEAASKLAMAHATALATETTAARAKEETDFQEFMKQTTTNNVASIKKEWGNDFEGNLAVAQRGIARVCSLEMKDTLIRTGLGNDPHFLKAFLAVGKMISEDTPPNGQATPVGRKTAEEVLYSNTH